MTLTQPTKTFWARVVLTTEAVPPFSAEHLCTGFSILRASADSQNPRAPRGSGHLEVPGGLPW